MKKFLPFQVNFALFISWASSEQAIIALLEFDASRDELNEVNAIEIDDHNICINCLLDSTFNIGKSKDLSMSGTVFWTVSSSKSWFNDTEKSFK